MKDDLIDSLNWAEPARENDVEWWFCLIFIAIKNLLQSFDLPDIYKENGGESCLCLHKVILSDFDLASKNCAVYRLNYLWYTIITNSQHKYPRNFLISLKMDNGI